jgi:hypothetical protein
MTAVERRGQRVLVPIAFAARRVRSHTQRSLLVGLGIAAGAAVFAMTSVGAVAVQDRGLQRALAGLQPSDRAIHAVWSGVPAQSDLSLRQLDRAARRELRPVLGRRPFRVEVFRQATWGGVFANLGAVDGLGRWVVLRSGRLPRRCTPDDCELVQIGGEPAAPRLSFLHVVGRATFRAGAPLTAYFGGAGGHRPPILLAEGVAGFARTPLPDAETIARTYGWVVPVEPGSFHDWELPDLRRRLVQAQAGLEQATDLFTLAAPIDTLEAVRERSRVARERLLILGGDAAVLLLGFAVLAATRLRRDHHAVRRRLTWAGATRAQTLVVTATEVVGVTAVASVAGWAAGTGAGGLLARRLGEPGVLAARHAVLSGTTLALAAALAVLTALVIVAALRAEPVAVGGLRLSVADVAALGALGAVLLAVARGQADATALSGGGTGVFLLLLPLLVLFVLAVAAARLLLPALRLLELAGRRGPVALRLSLLSLARSPGRVTLSVVFLLTSIGVALFAAAYRGTLERGERDQARFAVPAPFVLQEDVGKLVTVQQAAPMHRYAALGHVAPVLRDVGYVGSGGGLTILALPARALPRIDGWRTDFSAQTRHALSQLLVPPLDPSLRGPVLPPSARNVTLPLRVDGDQLGLALVVLNRRGDFTTLRLGELDRGTHAPTARVPAEARGGRVVALRLSFPVINAFVAGHKESGTELSVSDASTGTLRLGALRAGTSALSLRGWIGRGGIRATPTGIHYVLNRAADSVLRPREPLEGMPVPVIVSPGVARAAGADGTLTLHVGNAGVLGQVVATSRSFPSVDGDFAVADLQTWVAAANTLEPGTAVPGELWLDAPPAAAAQLAQPPFSALEVSSQRAVEADLRSDPLARGSLALLLATGAVAVLLAVVGLLLAIVGDVRDESGELFDLETQGASPRELRRHLLFRAGVVGVLGLAGGVAAGAALGALVVAIVTVTAGAERALPPLALVFDWKVAAVGIGALAVGAVLGAVAVTHGAYERVARTRFSEAVE